MAYIIVSYHALLPEILHPGIWACWKFRGFKFSLGYPLILIILKEVTPLPSFRGKINGLAPSVGAASRAITSRLGGYSNGVAARIGFTELAW